MSDELIDAYHLAMTRDNSTNWLELPHQHWCKQLNVFLRFLLDVREENKIDGPGIKVTSIPGFQEAPCLQAKICQVDSSFGMDREARSLYYSVPDFKKVPTDLKLKKGEKAAVAKSAKAAAAANQTDASQKEATIP